MSFSVDTVAIVGVGLLGASIGLGLRERGTARRIIGIGRRRESLAVAQRRGAIDSSGTELAAAASAELVIIATPAALVIPTLDHIRQLFPPEVIVTDVASTKGAICAHAASTWPAPRNFVGSHPMAGSEKFGPEHATADFYAGSVCLIEPEDEAIAPQAHGTVRALWECLGAEICPVDPAQHDQILARSSHLPHVAAAALAMNMELSAPIVKMIGNGFRDTTRIAAGRPEIWRDICLTNRDALLESLRDYQSLLSEFVELLERSESDGVEAFFDEGRRMRQQVLGE